MFIFEGNFKHQTEAFDDIILLVVGSLEDLSVQLVSSCNDAVKPGLQTLALCLSSFN